MGRLIVMAALTAAVSLAGGKDRVWEEGKLLDTMHNTYFPNTPAMEDDRTEQSARGFSNSGSISNRVHDRFVVETAESVFLVERVRFIPSEPPALRSFGPVKFSIEKKKIWLLDERGKANETTIVKQIAKPVGPPEPPQVQLPRDLPFTASLPSR